MCCVGDFSVYLYIPSICFVCVWQKLFALLILFLCILCSRVRTCSYYTSYIILYLSAIRMMFVKQSQLAVCMLVGFMV